MDAPTHAPTRTRTHVRQTQYEGYRRSDGLWDIDVLLRDERDDESQGFEGGQIAAGEPVHLIRLKPARQHGAEREFVIGGPDQPAGIGGHGIQRHGLRDASGAAWVSSSNTRRRDTPAASAPSARPNSASGSMRSVIRLATHSADCVWS